MKKSIFLLLCLTITNAVFAQKQIPEAKVSEIQHTFLKWWTYQTKNIMLSRDFIPLTVASKPTTKEFFFNELLTGKYIPVKMKSKSTEFVYQLYPIAAKADSSIKATIVQSTFDELEHLKMEGKVFPEFQFNDLNGTEMNNNSFKGKIVVIKCWYIHCAACIKEFPSVNELVANYKNRKDIVFVSLAEDTPEDLLAFLQRKPLSYSVVPNQKWFMNAKLNLNSFPTHIIINKEGYISKVVSNVESLEVALQKESKIP